MLVSPSHQYHRSSSSSSSMLFQASNSNSEWVAVLDNNLQTMMMEPQYDDDDHIYRFCDAPAAQPLFHLFCPSADDNEQQQPQQVLKIGPATTPPPTSLISRGADIIDDSTTTNMLNKLNHRVRERDRRKRLNDLYASLRSLLPPTPHMKQQSIPATVSRILKYIPELKQQVEQLLQQKQLLLSKITSINSTQIHHHVRRRQQLVVECKSGSGRSVCVSRLNEQNEVCVQISQPKISCMLPAADDHQILILQLSEVITALENVQGYFLINASSFQGTTTLFYTLHLQAERNMVVECEVLREKMLSLRASSSWKNNYIGRRFNF